MTNDTRIVHDGDSLGMIDYQGRLFAIQEFVDGHWAVVTDNDLLAQLVRVSGSDDDSTCPQCGTVGPEFDETPRPAAYCDHDRGPAMLPKLNIRCETNDGVAVGTTTLNVVRVEREDDGSFTAVTDHWPTATIKTAPDDAFCLETMNADNLRGYDYGSQEALAAVSEWLDDKSRAGLCTPNVQAVRERIWALLDMAAALLRVQAEADRWQRARMQVINVNLARQLIQAAIKGK